MTIGQLKRFFIGSPLRTRQIAHEKLPKWKALAIFSSDALSSVAYATEEILLVLALIGFGAFAYSLPIAIAILVLLTVVTLSYRQIVHAKGISDDIVAVTVDFDDEHAGQMREKWEKWNPNVPLIILRSPYRTVIAPLLKYIDTLEKEKEGDAFITVLVPQFIVRKWWHALLHNQTAFLLKAALIYRKDVVVSTIPFHLHE